MNKPPVGDKGEKTGDEARSTAVKEKEERRPFSLSRLSLRPNAIETSGNVPHIPY